VPIVVWTIKDLSSEELRTLHASVQAVVPKAGSAGRSLLEELRAFLQPIQAQVGAP
jgi:hypothetical protein